MSNFDGANLFKKILILGKNPKNSSNIRFLDFCQKFSPNFFLKNVHNSSFMILQKLHVWGKSSSSFMA